MAGPAETHEQVADSAKKIERAAGAAKSSADRTTQLAADRTVLAAERTYAAWVRTGLTALASGVGAKALLAKVIFSWLATLTGSVLILFSAFCFAAGVWREWDAGTPPPAPKVKRLPPALLLGVNGFLILVDLAALIGVWTLG